MLMKKNFIIVVVLLSLPFLAVAAKTVPGTVPQVRPLQPPAMGVNPNYTGNIESSDISRPAPARENFGNGQATVGSEAESLPADSATQESSKTVQARGNLTWLWLLIIFAGLGGLIWFAVNREKQSS